MPALTDDAEIQVCDLNDTATCVFREMENFYKLEDDDCDCEVPCETISYKPSLSYGAFPSYSFAFDEAKRRASPNSSGLNKTADDLHEKFRHGCLASTRITLTIHAIATGSQENVAQLMKKYKATYPVGLTPGRTRAVDVPLPPRGFWKREPAFTEEVDVSRRKTADGEEFFELIKSEPGAVLTSKNHTGGLDGSEDHSDGKIFPLATSRRCPVEVLKLYASYLNPKSEELFQRPKDLNSAKFNPITDNIWYEQRPLGQNTLENMLRKMTERAGIVPYLTNHSLRATTVTVLSANNIETRKIKAITGHKIDTSIDSVTVSDQPSSSSKKCRQPLALAPSSTAKKVPKHPSQFHPHPRLQFLYNTHDHQAIKDCLWDDTRRIFCCRRQV
ncbi:hypothetical protein ACROYT_G028053 [Oculina patagonica]